MTFERYVKRTIWVFSCTTEGCVEFGQTHATYTENPPREIMCNTCRNWMPPKEESWTGPEIAPSFTHDPYSPK